MLYMYCNIQNNIGEVAIYFSIDGRMGEKSLQKAYTEKIEYRHKYSSNKKTTGMVKKDLLLYSYYICIVIFKTI